MAPDLAEVAALVRSGALLDALPNNLLAEVQP
jgi:histidine ammonia-lyase